MRVKSIHTICRTMSDCTIKKQNGVHFVSATVRDPTRSVPQVRKTVTQLTSELPVVLWRQSTQTPPPDLTPAAFNDGIKLATAAS